MFHGVPDCHRGCPRRKSGLPGSDVHETRGSKEARLPLVLQGNERLDQRRLRGMLAHEMRDTGAAGDLQEEGVQDGGDPEEEKVHEFRLRARMRSSAIICPSYQQTSHKSSVS